jgi:hypothetical protein
MIIQDSRTRKPVLLAALDQIDRVLSLLSARLRASAASVVRCIKSAFREATRPLPLVTGFVADLGRSRRQLLAENAFLRQ